MKEKTIAVIGASGYSRVLIDEVVKNGKINGATLKAIVEVSDKALDKIKAELSIQVNYYKSMEEMYMHESIDLVLVASPIQFHKNHACCAMEHGSDVLLEKPLAGCTRDVAEIIKTRDMTGRKILAGFQLIYDESIREVKKVILSGKLGKLISIKCIVMWPRSRAYFGRNNWAGKMKDDCGRYIRDSVANNANAHHFMTLLYFAGQNMDSCGNITDLDAKLSKVYDIETFDTCAINAQFVSGTKMLAIASHASEEKQEPMYCLNFEKGKIECIEDEWKLYSDDGVVSLGKTDHNDLRKIWDIAKYIDDENYPVKCTLECATTHTQMIEALDKFDVKIIDKSLVSEKDGGYLYQEGLGERLVSEYESFY